MVLAEIVKDWLTPSWSVACWVKRIDPFKDAVHCCH